MLLWQSLHTCAGVPSIKPHALSSLCAMQVKDEEEEEKKEKKTKKVKEVSQL